MIGPVGGGGGGGNVIRKSDMYFVSSYLPRGNITIHKIITYVQNLF